MRAFALTIDQAIIFWELCHELKAETEEQRTAILDALADLGEVRSITSTPMTKEEYKKHLSKHFNVAEVTTDGNIVPSNGSIGIIPTSDDQPKGK